MNNINEYTDKIFCIQHQADFDALAIEAFNYQRKNCKVYSEYLKAIGKANIYPKESWQIPHLPIELFKRNKIVSEDSYSTNSQEIEYKLFTSSATTSMTPSKHYVKDLGLYEKSFTKGFEHFYGAVGNYNLLALLPSYLEREGSSLVYMADKLINRVKDSGGEGGFYLYNHKELLDKLLEIYCKRTENSSSSKKTILLGVSFALLDFAAYLISDECLAKDAVKNGALRELIIMETGGMKGRGKELSRWELHNILKERIGTPNIHSEYGMAELLSQAYLQEGEYFSTPPWMRIYTRDLYNPFNISTKGKGGINITDLANIHSCCFIETEDLGIVKEDSNICTGSSFSVLGRIAHSELRGCNMLLE